MLRTIRPRFLRPSDTIHRPSLDLPGRPIGADQFSERGGIPAAIRRPVQPVRAAHGDSPIRKDSWRTGPIIGYWLRASGRRRPAARLNRGVFGSAASNVTLSRFMHRIEGQHEAFSCGFATMARSLRSEVWAAAEPRNPAQLVTSANPLNIDIDASLVHVHSEKENSVDTYKDGYGLSPMIVMADYGGKAHGTVEVLAVHLRQGKKGVNPVASHIEVLHQELAQLPDVIHDEHGNL